MNKAYKFRIYPNKTQEDLFNKTFGCVRFIWNSMVAEFNDHKEGDKRDFKSSTEYRKEHEWMKEVSASPLQQKQRDFIEFKNQFFSKKRKKTVGRPNFKKKFDKQSYRLPNQKFKLFENKIQLEKIGKVSIVADREIPEDAKFLSVTISRNKVGQHFASILVVEVIKVLKKTGKTIGIDVGLSKFFVTSDNEIVDNPKFLRKNQAKLRKLQRSFSKTVKGGTNRERIRKRIARLHQRIVNQRNHFLHNLSIDLVRRYDIICVESLNIEEMLKNRWYSFGISDVSWSTFFDQLTYKCVWYGKELVKIDQYEPSSKTCSSCGKINEELTIKDRVFNCSCGISLDRDYNAAKNIKAVGVKTA